MNPVVIENHNVTFGAPRDWTPETSGDCRPLAVRVGMNGDLPMLESAWEPTPEELAMIAQGGRVVLRIIGSSHPPVWLHVEPAPSVPRSEVPPLV